MAKIELHAYKIHEARTDGSVSIEIGIGAGPPFPREIVEAKNVEQCWAALNAYADKARASGLKLQCRASSVKGSRAPAGFGGARLVVNVGV